MDSETVADIDTGMMPVFETEVEFTWDRLPHESDREWIPFKHYRDQGVVRLLSNTISEFKSVVSATNIRKYFKQNHWKSRVKAFDKYRDRRWAIAREMKMVAYRDKQRDRWLEIGEQMLDMSANILKMPMAKVERVVEKQVAKRKGEVIPTQINIVNPVNVSYATAIALAKSAKDLCDSATGDINWAIELLTRNGYEVRDPSMSNTTGVDIPADETIDVDAEEG